MDAYRGIRIGVVIQCEHGYFAGGGGGGWVYDNAGQKIKQFVGDGGIGHQANFIKAVRSRQNSDLNAPILEGHISSALCHIANISHRIGQRSSPDEIREAIQAETEAAETFDRFQEHLFANQIDVAKSRAVLGPWLTMDPEEEKFIGTGEFGTTFWANDLLTRDYREPFVVPEKV